MQQSLYVACRACSVYSLTLHRKFAKACQTSSDWAGTLCAWGQSGLPVTDSNWEKDSFREAIIKNKTKKINHLPAAILIIKDGTISNLDENEGVEREHIRTKRQG